MVVTATIMTDIRLLAVHACYDPMKPTDTKIKIAGSVGLSTLCASLVKMKACNQEGLLLSQSGLNADMEMLSLGFPLLSKGSLFFEKPGLLAMQSRSSC